MSKTPSQFTVRAGTIIQETIDENGQVIEKVVCKSYGPTPITVINDGEKIQPTEILRDTSSFTITEAPQGTMLKIFLVPKSDADGDEWFMFGDYAVYMTTSNNIRGFERRWCSEKNFGQLFLECVSRKELERGLNPNFAYTVFLRHPENDILEMGGEPIVHLCCLYDVDNDTFIHPQSEFFHCPEGIQMPKTFMSNYCTDDVIDVREHSHVEGKVDTTTTLVEVGEEGVLGDRMIPLLMTFYDGNSLVSLKYEQKVYNELMAIRTLDNDVERSLFAANLLKYPGVVAYCRHFNLDLDKQMRIFNSFMHSFETCINKRFNKKQCRIPYNMYKYHNSEKLSIEKLVMSHDFTWKFVRDESFSRLYEAVADRRMRYKILDDIYNEFVHRAQRR